MAEQSCKECGCHCRSCEQGTLHLHVEIENLKQRLVERDRHIVTMETNFLSEADKFPDGEYAALTEELLTWQEKYSRLYESYKRVQKVNQGLEDKLLRVVDKCESEKGALTRDVASLTQRLVDARFNVSRLQEENERYRNDLSLAIQFLQCKPANFVPQKFEQLPSELQQKVRMYMTSKRRPSDSNGLPPKVERRTIKVPIPTFPPTAMVYSVNKAPNEKDLSDEEREIGDGKAPVDIVSAAILAKILEERERERLNTRHCDSCTCPTHAMQVDVGTQTVAGLATPNASLCSRCGETTSPSPARMSLRYSSSLLGSGEASQVLVSLADDPDPSPMPVTIPSSQPCSARHSPRESISNNMLTSMLNYKPSNDIKKTEETDDNLRLNSEVKVSSLKSLDTTGWDDWNQNVDCNKKVGDKRKVDSVGGAPQGNQPGQVLVQTEVDIPDMPKVSTNSSPSFFRVNASVVSSSVSQDASLSRRQSRVTSSKGKSSYTQEAASNTYSVDTPESKDPENFLINVESPRVTKESLNLDSSSQCSALNSNFGLKINQARLLPETKLFASGDTLEVLPSDPLTSPRTEESERRLSNTSLKGSSQVSSSHSSRSPRSSEMKDKDVRVSGPRPCSLRFQAGSNNILLDNAHSYAPVLYTSRQHTSSTSRGNDPLVHAVHGVRSRSASASSTDDIWNQISPTEPASIGHPASNQRLQQRVSVCRTETGV